MKKAAKAFPTTWEVIMHAQNKPAKVPTFVLLEMVDR
jgi:hypothetical protein